MLSIVIFLKYLNSPVIQSILLLWSSQSVLLLSPPRQLCPGLQQRGTSAAEGHQELWWQSPHAVLFHSHTVLRSEAASGSLVARFTLSLSNSISGDCTQGQPAPLAARLTDQRWCCWGWEVLAGVGAAPGPARGAGLPLLSLASQNPELRLVSPET